MPNDYFLAVSIENVIINLGISLIHCVSSHSSQFWGDAKVVITWPITLKRFNSLIFNSRSSGDCSGKWKHLPYETQLLPFCRAEGEIAPVLSQELPSDSGRGLRLGCALLRALENHSLFSPWLLGWKDTA